MQEAGVEKVEELTSSAMTTAEKLALSQLCQRRHRQGFLCPEQEAPASLCQLSCVASEQPGTSDEHKVWFIF